MMEANEMFLNDSTFIYPLVTSSVFFYPLHLRIYQHYPHLFSYFVSPYFTNYVNGLLRRNFIDETSLSPSFPGKRKENL